MAAHLQNHHRQAEKERDPEPPCHVGQLGIWTFLRARYLWFERHAADGSTAGADLTNLWMHWAGVDGPRADRFFWRGRLPLGVDIARRDGGDVCSVALAAEMI